MTNRRDLFLVRKKETWAICFKATGRLDSYPTKVVAWLHALNEAYFCTVGTEDQLERLPDAHDANFFGDPFIYSVDEVDEKGKRIVRLAGADNVSAARAAFHVYVKALPPARRIELRYGAGVLLKAHDNKIDD